MRFIINFMVLIFMYSIASVAFSQEAVVPALDVFAKISLWVIGPILLLIEYFIGKTDLIKANSTLEAILNGIVKVGKAIFQKR